MSFTHVYHNDKALVLRDRRMAQLLAIELLEGDLLIAPTQDHLKWFI